MPAALPIPAPVTNLRPAVAAILQPDEVIILVTRPGLWYIILRNLEGLLAVAAFWLVLVLVNLSGWLVVDTVKVGLLSMGFILLNILWLAIDRICRLYILTDRRIIRCTGVFRTLTIEFPFTRIQGVAIYKSLRERFFAMGSIVFTTNIESTLGGDVWWLMLDTPDAKLALIQQTMSRYRQP